MTTISQLNSSLYFNLVNSFIYVSTGNTGALNLSTINGGGNEIKFLTINSLTGTINIPSDVTLDIQNASITNLQSINNTGVNGNITGPTGVRGIQGTPGNPGNQGNQGLQGLQGLQGIQGLRSNRGFEGFQGNYGNQGLQGFQSESFSVTNFEAGRLTTSIGTVNQVMAHTGITFSSKLLTVGGNVSATGSYVQSVKALTGGTGTIDTTQMINILPGNAFGSYATRISGTSEDAGKGIAVDTSGNSYITGYYSNEATFYNSDGTTFKTMTTDGLDDCFVVKYGPTGIGLWTSKIGDVSGENGNSIAVDITGNSYVTGSFSNQITVYNSDTTVFKTLDSIVGTNCFIVKYGSTGMGSFVTRMSSSLGVVGNSIVADNNENSYITGYYRQPATIYNSDGTTFTIVDGSGSFDCLIVKYGSTGMGQWVSRISGAGSDIGSGITVDSSGNSYVTGNYGPPATIYNSDGTSFTTFNDGNLNCFIVKYGPTGMADFATRVIGTNVSGKSVDVDTNGNCYVTGEYALSCTIYNSNNTVYKTLEDVSSTNFDCFVVKFGSTGMGNFATNIIKGGTNNERGYGITVDTFGNSYVTGLFTSTAVVNNSDGTAFTTLSGSGSDDCFVVEYGPTGMGLWATRISGTSGDVGSSIAVDNNGNPYVTGYYTGTGTIYNSDGTAYKTLSASGGSDVFIVKYSSQYNLTDLSNVSTNYGKSVNLVNQYQPTQSTVNLKNTSGNTYGTYTVDYAKTFVFNNGTWYPSVNL